MGSPCFIESGDNTLLMAMCVREAGAAGAIPAALRLFGGHAEQPAAAADEFAAKAMEAMSFRHRPDFRRQRHTVFRTMLGAVLRRRRGRRIVRSGTIVRIVIPSASGLRSGRGIIMRSMRRLGPGIEPALGMMAGAGRRRGSREGCGGAQAQRSGKAREKNKAVRLFHDKHLPCI